MTDHNSASAAAQPHAILRSHAIDDVAWGRPVSAPRPNYEIGDALFFPDGLPLTWQLRPALKSDISIAHRVEIGPGSYFLVRSWPRIGVLRWFLTLPYHRRKNSFSNVQYALRANLAKQPHVLELARSYDALAATMAPTDGGAS